MKPNVWRWGRKGTAVVAWTVVGLEVTVLVRDLAAAKTTLPEFLDSIRRDFGPVGEGSPRNGGGEGAQLLAEGGNATDAVGAGGQEGLRHRTPSSGMAAAAAVEGGGSVMS